MAALFSDIKSVHLLHVQPRPDVAARSHSPVSFLLANGGVAPLSCLQSDMRGKVNSNPDNNQHLLFIKPRLPIVPPRCQRVPILVSVESKETHTEAEGVQHLMLDRGEKYF